jgi:cell shape-determining protein MreD
MLLLLLLLHSLLLGLMLQVLSTRTLGIELLLVLCCCLLLGLMLQVLSTPTLGIELLLVLCCCLLLGLMQLMKLGLMHYLKQLLACCRIICQLCHGGWLVYLHATEEKDVNGSVQHEMR